MGNVLLRREWVVAREAGWPGWELVAASGWPSLYVGDDNRGHAVYVEDGAPVPRRVTVPRFDPRTGADRLPVLRRWCRVHARGDAYLCPGVGAWSEVVAFFQLDDDVCLFRLHHC